MDENIEVKEKTAVEVLEELLNRTKKKITETGDQDWGHAHGTSPIWCIITGLRGPDDNDCKSPLKDLTTARIRGILDIENKWFEARYDPLTDQEIALRNKLLAKRTEGFYLDHFNEHFERAMKGLQGLGYEVPEKELSF